MIPHSNCRWDLWLLSIWVYIKNEYYAFGMVAMFMRLLKTSGHSKVFLNRSLEALWLLTIVLVPLAFIDNGFFVSEAAIGYLEVPKVVLLRC